MRHALIAFALALAACGTGDDDGTDPGVDGGDGSIVGDYTATWSPVYAQGEVRFAYLFAYSAGSAHTHGIAYWYEPPPADLLERMCAPGEARCTKLGGDYDGDCLAIDSAFTVGMLCATADGFAGTVIDDNDGNPIEYTITMTRL